jgi:YVTN family beta-propeller protein
VTPDGASVYCANSNDGTVSVIDVGTGNVTDTIAVGNGPYSVAVTPDGASVYRANGSDDSTVSVIVEFPFYALGTG